MNSYKKSKIYVSYAWGGQSEEIVELLESAFLHKGVEIIRDKNELSYKDSIRSYMKELGKGRCVVLIVNAKYLQSKNCMFELLEIAKNGELVDRIFPVVLSDAGIYDVQTRLGYVKHWESKMEELNAELKSVGSQANLHGFREELDLYTLIRAGCAQLLDILVDMNALSPDEHRDSDFDSLISSIEETLANDFSGSQTQLTSIEEIESSLETQMPNP